MSAGPIITCRDCGQKHTWGPTHHGCPATISGHMDRLPQRALSIRQPWAWAIINAGKDIENRNWKTAFRGPVCIHAAKGMTEREWEEAMAFIDNAFPVSLVSQIGRRRSASGSLDAKRGGIIGVAEIVDCVDASDSPWFFGRYGFVLRNARPVEFIPVKGALGFFDWRKNLPHPYPNRSDANG